MSMQSTVAAASNYGHRTVTVTQSLPDIERYEAYRRKTAAFEEWRQKLSRSDRLPRGRFFKGKLPGRKHMALDEFWLGNANTPYDLSQFKPFETLAFGYPPQPKVTAESLAMFQAMEGINLPTPGALAFMASAEACKPELESDMGAFSYTSVPLQGNCRWFVRRGDTVKYERGFRSKQDASDWINAFGERLDWSAGFTFRLKGDSTHMEIVNRQGDVAKA